MKKITHSEAIVLQAVAKGYRHGFDVIEQTGIAGGTIYPALRRLERQWHGALAMGTRHACPY